MKTLTSVLTGLVATAAFAFDAPAPVAAANRPVALRAITCASGTQQFADREGTFCRRADGVVHGPYVGFHTNGVKNAEGAYVDGQRSGRWFFFDEQGRKVGQTDFKLDKYDGERIVFAPNGQVQLREQYVAGKREGEQVVYDLQGKVMTVTQFQGDRAVATK